MDSLSAPLDITFGLDIYASQADPTSGVNTWDQLWENTILPDFQVSKNLFEDVDPIIDFEGLGPSWSSIQEWADTSFQVPFANDAALQAIELETMAAGGVRFCCYGMIPDVSVKLVGEMLSLRTKVDPSQPYQSFAVSKHSEYFMLKSLDNEVFALVGELASQGLAALQDLSSVEIMAFAETAKIQSVLTKAKKPGEATLKVEINVYGSIDIAEVVGRKLGAAKLFLQDPDHGQQDIEYCNPHVVHFPGVEEPKPQSTDCVVPEVM